MNAAPLFGLVLAGGASTRMRSDKAALIYHERPQLHHTFDLAASVCERAFISVRADHADDPVRRDLPQIVDRVSAGGPVAGILSALQAHPHAAWLVLACDLPFIDRATLSHLVANRSSQRIATAFLSAHDGLAEPLCAIYEPSSRELLQAYVATGRHCPRKFLMESAASLIALPFAQALDNVNTREEHIAALDQLADRGDSARDTHRTGARQ